MADVLGRLGVGRLWVRRMLLQHARTSSNWLCYCSRRRHETWRETEMGEKEGGRVVGVFQVGGDDHCDACGWMRTSGQAGRGQ